MKRHSYRRRLHTGSRLQCTVCIDPTYLLLSQGYLLSLEKISDYANCEYVNNFFSTALIYDFACATDSQLREHSSINACNSLNLSYPLRLYKNIRRICLIVYGICYYCIYIQ